MFDHIGVFYPRRADWPDGGGSCRANWPDVHSPHLVARVAGRFCHRPWLRLRRQRFSALLPCSASTVILDFIRTYQRYIHIFGGLFMLAVAWHTWRNQPKQPPHPKSIAHRVITLATNVSWLVSLQSFITGLAITLTNPLTLFAILSVVATFGDLKKNAEASILISGIFAGSVLWWLILSGGIASVRNHFTESRILLVNRVTALILAAIALWAIASGIGEFLGVTLPKTI